MKRSHLRHRRPIDFESIEFVLVLVATIVLTIVDLFFIVAAKEHQSDVKVVHEVFQGFLLSLVISLSVCLAVRWYRHRDELLEAFNHFKEMSKYPDVDELIKDIALHSLSIRQKKWPRHATEQLIHKLEELQSFVQSLNSGRLSPVPSEVATNEELNLFLESTGTIFVTDYGDISRYWNDQPGRHMLAVNDLAIKHGCTIVRVFILPPYKGPLDKVGIPENFAGIIEEQLNINIDVRMIRAEAVMPQYCKDVGLFYEDKAYKQLAFVSVWRRNPDEGIDESGQWYAEWYFNHSDFNFYDLMRRRLEHQATPITSRDDLERFLSEGPNPS